MSDPAENVAIVERAYAGWAERGPDVLREVMHDEVEWHPPPQAPEPGPYRGPDEIMGAVASYMESFGEFRPVPDRILPGAEPDQVLVMATLTTVGRGSGAEFTMPVGHLITMRDGKVIRFKVFTDPDEAVCQAGLRPEEVARSRVGAAFRALMAAFNGHDVEAGRALIAPEGEVYGLRSVVEGTSYRGPEGAERFWADIDEVWGRIEVRDAELLERGDEGLVIATLILEGRGSGLTTERRVAVHVEVDEQGLITRFLTQIDPEAARADFEAGRRPEPG